MRRTVVIWNVAPGSKLEVLKNFKAHGNGIVSIGYAGKNTIATCSGDKTVKIWNWAEEPALLCELKTRGIASDVCMIDDDTVFIAGGDATIRIYNWKEDRYDGNHGKDGEFLWKNLNGYGGALFKNERDVTQFYAHDMTLQCCVPVLRHQGDPKHWTEVPIMYQNVTYPENEEDSRAALEQMRPALIKIRRLATHLGPCHSNSALRSHFVDLARFAYNEVAEFRGAHPEPGGSLAEESQEKPADQSPEEEDTEAPEEPAVEKAPKTEKKSKKESTKVKDKKAEKGKAKDHRSRSRKRTRGDKRSSPDRESSRRPKRTREKSPEEKKLVKQEPSEEEADRSPLEVVEGEVSPAEAEEGERPSPGPSRPASAPKRTAAGALRRPSAEEEEEAAFEEREEAPEKVSGEEEYLRGALVESHQVPPGRFKKGDLILIPEGSYNQQLCPAAVRVEQEVIEENERELVGVLSGIKNEQLLRFGTSHKPCRVRVHLCRPSCTQLREGPDLVHAKRLRRLRPEDEKSWELNLVEESETQLLAADQAEWRRREEEKLKHGAEVRSSSSESRKRRKKKKKKKKAKPKEDAEQGEKRSPERPRLGGKTVARKSLESLYAGTGMDPSVRHRKKLTKKVRRVLKRNRDSSSSATSSTSTTSSDMEGDMILADRSKVHRISTLAPGLLASQSISQMKQFVTQASGSNWDLDEKTLPPIMTQYARVHLSSRLSGGVGKEFQTLAWIGDLLVQARPAEALDALCQRMKAIEMTSAGTAWTTSQKLELVPVPEPSMSSRQEAQLAKKEAKLDQDVKGGYPQTEKGRGKGKEKTQKGQPKGKGKNKEAEGKKPS
eukprot:s1646_g1.t1